MYSITLQTTDDIITSGDRIGQLQYAASNEADGSAAILVAGSVYTQAEGVFTSSENPTSIVLATAAADASAATARMKLTDKGHWLPVTNDTSDLGDSNLQFRNAYMSEGIVLTANTPSDTTNKLYNEGGTLKFDGSALGGGGISNVVEDTTPQLGGDLEMNGNQIKDADLVSSITTAVPLTVNGIAAQSANLTEWVDSNNEPLAEIDKDGFLRIHNSGVEWDATDYEVFDIKWTRGSALDGSFVEIGTTNGGTGTRRPIHFGSQSVLNPKPSFSSTAVRSVSFGAGQYNKIYGRESVVINAINSTANSQRGILIGGYYSIIGSGADISDCENGAILGGYNNTMKNCNSAPVIVGGRQNKIDVRNESYAGGNSDVIIGGSFNTNYNTTGGYPFNRTTNAIIGGSYNQNIAAAHASIIASFKSKVYESDQGVVIGGYKARVIQDNGVAFGDRAVAHIKGEIVQGGGNLGGGYYQKLGELDRSSVVLGAKTTDDTGTAGFDGYTLLHPVNNSSFYLDILPSSTWTFRAQISAYNSTDQVGAGFSFEGVVRRDNSDSTAIVGVVDSKSWAEGSLTGVIATVTTDDTNERLNVLVSGLASKTIHWSAFVDSSRVRGEGYSEFAFNP